jgi:hypothetical protein
MSILYFKSINGKKSRPYTIDELKEKGNLFKTELIWREGLSKWSMAKDIEELRIYAIQEPPKTNFENKIDISKYSLIKSFWYFIIFSIFIGVFSSLVEKYQYQNFINSIKKIDHSHDNNTMSSSNKMVEYSNIRFEELHAQNEDGTFYSRWIRFHTLGMGDNEQLSYDYSHSFLFRPYKALFDVTYLSQSERESIFELFKNFILSSFASNIFFFPILFFLMYKLNINEIK